MLPEYNGKYPLQSLEHKNGKVIVKKGENVMEKSLPIRMIMEFTKDMSKFRNKMDQIKENIFRFPKFLKSVELEKLFKGFNL